VLLCIRFMFLQIFMPFVCKSQIFFVTLECIENDIFL
jgi:hypothetical protein